jgi:hemolysin activation/secretion protein
MLVLALPAFVHAQDTGTRLPPAAEPDVRLEQLPSREPDHRSPEVEVPKGMPTRTPAGAERVRFVLEDLDIEGLTAYPEAVIRKFYAEWIGTEVSLADVYDIAAEIQRFYRQDGYFLTRVILPAQTTDDGRLRMVVIEGFISDIQIQGEVGPVEDRLRAYFQNILCERPLKLKTLERYLLLARDVPGLVVNGVLRPAPDQVGAAQLVVTVERKSLDGLAIVNNFGSTFIGEWELAASVSTNSFTSMGERMTLSGLLSTPWKAFSGDEETQKVFQLVGSLRPGSQGLYVGFLGSYGNSNPGGIISQFLFDSRKLLLSANAGYPIIRLRDHNISAELGFDYIDSDTDIFDDITFSRDRLRVLHLTFLGDVRDAWRGSSFFSVGLRQGLPILNASESGDDFLSRVDADGVFTSIQGEAWRLQPIMGHLVFYGRVAGQYAFDPLLIDEEFGVGSIWFGRGYNPRELSADHGIGFTGELQYTRAVDLRYVNRFQVFCFYDFGKVWERDLDLSASLSSAGGGVRGWLPYNLFLELQVAKPLTRDSVRADDTRDPQVLFRIFVRF